MLRVFFLTITLLFAVSFPAAAACQLAGKYRTFALGAGGAVSITQNCLIKVGIAGNVYGGFCDLRDEFGNTLRDNILGGKWSISNTCIVSGHIRFAEGKSRIEAAINGATIVGRVRSVGTAILFAGVKVP